MKTKFYLNNEKLLTGISLRDESEPEEGNMALHACTNPEHILANRKKLAESLNCKVEDLVCASQTHSANFYKVALKDKGRGAVDQSTAIPDTDALYTDEPNLLLCCFTADCVPVIFYHEAKGFIGVIHSGWMGTVKEITSKVLEHMITVEECSSEDFRVYIGTALSQERFEVDEDVYNKFKGLGYADEFMYYNDETHKFHIDNQQIVQWQCKMKGITDQQIIVDRTCTYAEGFSYRKNRQCGRHMSFIMKKI